MDSDINMNMDIDTSLMDLGKYLDEFNTISRIELQKIRDCSPNQMAFETKARSLHLNRIKIKENGRAALNPGRLFDVLSVCIQPDKDVDEPFSVYGSIDVEFLDVFGNMVTYSLYKRDRRDSEILSKGNALTLNGPEYSCLPDHSFLPMFRSKVVVDLSDVHDTVVARGCFLLDDSESEGGYEKVKTVFLPCQQGSLVVKYMAISFGIFSRVEIMFVNRHSKKHDFINVNGKIVARFVNNYGNSSSEEFILFSKQANESQRVELDHVKMQLSRCWLALPAYSSLVISMDLSESQTGREIVNDTIQLLPRQDLMSGDSIVLDDMIIRVRVAWFSPTPLGPQEDEVYQPDKVSVNFLSSLSPTPQITNEDENVLELKVNEDIDFEGEHEMSSDDDRPSFTLNTTWRLRPHKIKPIPIPAVEIFSVFIGRENSKALQLHGSIKVLSGYEIICYVFRREQNNALCLPEHVKSTPILDDSRAYEYCSSLEMKIDLKSVDGTLAIKGYEDWGDSVLDSDSLYHDKQVCSFIQGENGFAAIHYSVFSSAVGAVVKVFLNFENLDTRSVKVYGRLSCQYRYFDYSSRYNQEYYRSELFTRPEECSAQLSDDGLVPLSRSFVVVPSFSSLVVNVDLSTGVWGQQILLAQEFEIGEDCKTNTIGDCTLRIEVDWCDIK